MMEYRVPAFLLLLLLSIPNKANGLKCYICDNCDNPDVKDCDGACFTSNLKQGCFSKSMVDCFSKASGGDCYKPEADNDKQIGTKLKECLGEELGPTCICPADLCNFVNRSIPSNLTSDENNSPTALNGISCFKCDGPPDSDCYKGIKGSQTDELRFREVHCPNTEYCVKFIQDNGWMRRNCYDQADGMCWIQKITGKNKNGCAGKQDQAKFSEFMECITKFYSNQNTDSSDIGQRINRDGENCACKGDLCNKAGGKNPSIIIIISALIFAL